MEKKIKILHITTSGNFGGTEKMIYYFIKMSSKNFENVLVILKDEGEFLEKIKKLNVKTYFINIKNIFNLSKLFKVYKIIKTENPDIIHSYLFHSNIIARILGKTAGIKNIVCGQRNIDKWKNIFHILLDRITSIYCKLIISNTEAGKNRLVKKEKINPGKIIVIQNGVEKPFVPKKKETIEWKNKFNIPNNATIISTAASLTKKKGIPYLIKAFELAANEYSDIHLIIAGKGPLECQLKELSKQQKNKDRIHFVGFQNNINFLLSATDIFVLPSLWEGMPNAILEAMSFGIPVIATNVGGTPEIIKDGENGFLIPPENEYAIYEKIKYCLENQEKIKIIGLNAKKETENKFSIEKMVKKLEAAYLLLVND